MSWYANKLVMPIVRNNILVFCLILFGFCIYGTSQLEQKFEPQDYVPSDSYTHGFFERGKAHPRCDPFWIKFNFLNPLTLVPTHWRYQPIWFSLS